MAFNRIDELDLICASDIFPCVRLGDATCGEARTQQTVDVWAAEMMQRVVGIGE
jgi:hypothetical protein